jgi:hypothetical protein
MSFIPFAAILYMREVIRTLFLVKEIVSKEGKVHFRRWRILATPWFNIYIHNILRSDEEAHPHDHPWNFLSFVLKGGYSEEWLHFYEDKAYQKGAPLLKSVRRPGTFVYHDAKDFHKLTLLKGSAWTLVFTFGKRRPSWGFQTEQGWLEHKAYRELKYEGKLR